MESLKPGDIQPGDLYEDCAYHPVFCTRVDDDGAALEGISLIDGSHPRACDIVHCGVIKLTAEQALRWKMLGPDDVDSKKVEPDKKWWGGWEEFSDPETGEVLYRPIQSTKGTR